MPDPRADALSESEIESRAILIPAGPHTAYQLKVIAKAMRSLQSVFVAEIRCVPHDLEQRVAGLVAKWRERVLEGEGPSDRLIGFQECADELAAALQRTGASTPTGWQPDGDWLTANDLDT